MTQFFGVGGRSSPARKIVAGLNRLMGRGQRSNGVPVSALVYSAIAKGNSARSVGDWERAAFHYEAALQQAPHLAHIWMQLGHMRKEQGEYDLAMEAYAQVEAIDPTQKEAVLHQGYVGKLQKRGDVAANHFLRLYRNGGRDPDALRELLELLERGSPVNRDMVGEALGVDAEAKARTRTRGWDGDAIVFDASDLISYFGNARLPTGIQRVQIATIAGAIETRPKGSVMICCFSDLRDDWLEIPIESFVELCGLALQSGDRTDPEWLDAYSRLRIEVNLAPPLIFPHGAYLVNLGTSWWLQNYFMFVREAKRLYGIRYIPFVHDFIPIMTPEHCVKELTQDFITWALGVFQHADFFLVNSQATARDLLKVAAVLGHDVREDAVAVIPLNARFRSPDAPVAPASRLLDWGLVADDFVLIVSTIESRKNHIGALDAWLELLERHGAKAVPKLVCVGNRGWLNDAVYDRIGESRLLRSRVVMLSGLSDEELGLLYQACRFTLYPSNYEGWGLPVTESLCFGKVPLISDSSSLPEAGGPFAVYFKAGSTEDMVGRAERLIFDDAERQRLEDYIATDFHPRGWEDVAAQIGEEIEAFVAVGEDKQVQAQSAGPVLLGRYYPIVRNYETRIWRGMALAEIYRSGTGWWWPDDWGCWTKPGGGDLLFRFLDQKGPLRGLFKVLGPPEGPCRFSIQAPELGVDIKDVLKAGEYRWISVDLPDDLPPDGMRICFRGSVAVDLAERSGGLDCRVISLGVAGFYFYHAEDLNERLDFLEALAFNGLDRLAFNREPIMMDDDPLEEGMEEW